MTDKIVRKGQRRPAHDNLTATQEKYLLALYRLQITGVSQMEVARELGVTPVSTSKTMRELVEEGLVERKNQFSIQLSQEGQQLAERLDDRYTTIMWFLASGLDMEENLAEQEALELALAMSPEFSAAFLRKIEEDAVQYPVNYQDICTVAQVLREGRYTLPFQLLRLQEDKVSMGDKGFLHPCLLEVRDGRAELTLYLSDVSCRCRSVAGRPMVGRLTQLRYRVDGDYQEAQMEEARCCISLERLEMKLDTHGNPRSGCLPVRVATSVGVNVMPHSSARLILNFRAMKKLPLGQSFDPAQWEQKGSRKL